MIKLNNTTYNILRKTQNPELAEKDYLECVVLDKLFNNAYFCDNFVFGGGASLLKSYQLSMRTGQDLDLICMDFDELSDDHSRKQLEKFKKGFKLNVFGNIKVKIGEIINKNKEFLIMTDADWCGLKNMEMFLTSPTLHLMYRSNFGSNLGHMCIEIIPRKYSGSDIEARAVIPYSLKQPVGNVPTIKYENTFWDKVYALHSNAVSAHQHTNQFFSRHYYDVATLASVVDIKQTKNKLFEIEKYQAKYTLKNITPLESTASVQLLPDEDAMQKLGADFTEMSDRFVCEHDDWKTVTRKLHMFGKKLKTL